MCPRGQLIKIKIQLMIFLSIGNWKIIKEKYKQLYLALQFDRINTIEYTQSLPPSVKDRNDRYKLKSKPL